MHAIYGLVDPRDRKVFYVGQTTDVYKRFIEHISCSSGNLARNVRIMELRALNLMVIMEVFELVDDKLKANDREAYWIKHFEQSQHPLTNITFMSSPRKARREQIKAATRLMQPVKYEEATLRKEPPIDPNSMKIGINLITRQAVTITKEQFHMLLLKRKNGTLTGYRQIMKLMPMITEQHAKNLNSMLLKELNQDT